MVSVIIIAFLGIIQGLAEVFPISSSFHLNSFSMFLSKFLSVNDLAEFLSMYDSGFDVVLHAGSFFAFLMFFRRNIAELVYDSYYCIRCIMHNNDTKKYCAYDGFAKFLSRIFCISLDTNISNYEIRFIHIFCVMIPIVLVTLGVHFICYTDQFKLYEHYFDTYPAVYYSIIFSIISAIMLYFVHALRSVNVYAVFSAKHAFIIGLMQSLAIFPGMSRFGMCLMGFRFLNYDLQKSVFLSLILSIPAIFGSIVFKIHKIQFVDWHYMAIGAAISFVCTKISLPFAMKFFNNYHSIFLVTIYRIFFALCVYCYFF